MPLILAARSILEAEKLFSGIFFVQPRQGCWLLAPS